VALSFLHERALREAFNNGRRVAIARGDTMATGISSLRETPSCHPQTVEASKLDKELYG
jgi:hypothetical protein